MGDTILYLRAPIPFGVRHTISAGLIRDAKILLDLDINQINAIRDDLRTFPGFLDREMLSDILHRHIEDERSCRRLAQFILAVDDRLRTTERKVDHLISLVRKWLDGKENRKKRLLSREQFQELEQRLPLLIEPFSGLSRQAKAERLSQVTGLPLEDLQIICDLRPVFDNERECVEGMIPFTTLRIVCKGVDGLPVALDAVLSRTQVSELLTKATAAEKKLSRLEELLSSKGLPVPCVPLTKQDR